MTTASAAAPVASNIRPRCRSGSCEVTRTALTPSIAASPSAPCDSADLAVAASFTSTMKEIPSPSAIAWLSLLTSGDRSRRGANPVVTGCVPIHRCAPPPPVLAVLRRARARRGGRRPVHHRHDRRTTASSERHVRTRSAALGGRDALLGRGGADFLNGGPGRDTMDAGPGADRPCSRLRRKP